MTIFSCCRISLKVVFKSQKIHFQSSRASFRLEWTRSFSREGELFWRIPNVRSTRIHSTIALLDNQNRTVFGNLTKICDPCGGTCFWIWWVCLNFFAGVCSVSPFFYGPVTAPGVLRANRCTLYGKYFLLLFLFLFKLWLLLPFLNHSANKCLFLFSRCSFASLERDVGVWGRKIRPLWLVYFARKGLRSVFR